MFAQESVMGINKEREDFEAEFSKIKSDIAFWLHTWDEEMQGYNHPVMCWFWYMWQTAKAKAVPEGFVVVNKKDLARVLNCMMDDWLVDTDSFEEFKKIESLVQDEVNAMIEPQEPAND